MPDLKTYDLFISHAWQYNSEYYRLVQLLNNASLFRYRNYSVPEHEPLDANNTQKLNDALQRQIKPVNVVLIISGMYVNHRPWIQYEIEVAKNLSKPIVGIHPLGSERTPAEVQAVAKAMVHWNTTSIVEAIRRYAL